MTPFTFGKRLDGSKVTAIELRNTGGMMVRVLTLGATIQALHVPDKKGALNDVVLGHATVAEYETRRQYLGATVGRYANRIARGAFTLAGQHFKLDTNDGPNHLHGGQHGFDLANWNIDSLNHLDSGNQIDSGQSQLLLSHESADGDGGYPGNMRVTATFSLNAQNALTIDYRAETDRSTIANITHHGYFNLSGESSGNTVLNHRLRINAETFTPIDSDFIPTGELRQVANTPFDFTDGKRIGAALDSGSNFSARSPSDEQLHFARGYDHNFVIDGASGKLRTAALLADPKSGRAMEVLTTAPGMQFYSGNFLDGTSRGKSGLLYKRHAGLCLEPHYFPDSPNKPHFPSAVLHPGEVFHTRIVFRFFANANANVN
jgi:aldose 1-epimerase